jgi:membrane protein required for colicin V production
MTGFDFAVIAVIAISTLAAFVHGFMRVAASLVAWVVGIVAAARFASAVGPMLPDFGESPATRYVLAFVLILLAVLLVGGLVGYLLARMLRTAGLGFLDRGLGAVVGFARGILIAVLLVLLAGLTALPKADWWQNALLSPPLTVAALSLRPWLPRVWADRLDYGKERRPAKAVVTTEGSLGNMRGLET